MYGGEAFILVRLLEFKSAESADKYFKEASHHILREDGLIPRLCLSLCLSVCPSVFLSVCLPVCLSICLSICLSVCLSLSLSLSLSAVCVCGVWVGVCV